MKNKYIPQSVVAVVGSLSLLLATANAKDNNKDGDGQSEKEDRKEKKEDKAEKKEDKREAKENKAENKEDRREAKEDKAENKEDRREAKDDKMDRRDNKDFDTRKIVRFEDNDRKVIFGYFDSHRGRDNGLPPGLVRRGKPLPPGWHTRFIAGYRIEDEWWASFTLVPYDWFPNLRREPNTALYFHGDRIVRVYEPRREVIEVMVVPGIRN